MFGRQIIKNKYVVLFDTDGRLVFNKNCIKQSLEVLYRKSKATSNKVFSFGPLGFGSMSKLKGTSNGLHLKGQKQ